jgi:hypothetical protein
MEKPVDVRLDPRVEMSNDAVELQTRYSLAMYHAYEAAQGMIELIDLVLSDTSVPESRKAPLAALRGSGAAGDPDIVYGSIYSVPAEDETLVGLQEKALFVLNVLQGADVRPTSQAMEAAEALERMLAALGERWEMTR